MSPDFRLSGLAGALALALAAAAPMAASADEPVMATGQAGTKITLGPTNLPWNHMNYAGLDLMLPWGYVEGYPVVANSSMAYTMRSGYKLSIPRFCMRQY